MFFYLCGLTLNHKLQNCTSGESYEGFQNWTSALFQQCHMKPNLIYTNYTRLCLILTKPFNKMQYKVHDSNTSVATRMVSCTFCALQ